MGEKNLQYFLSFFFMIKPFSCIFLILSFADPGSIEKFGNLEFARKITKNCQTSLFLVKLHRGVDKSFWVWYTPIKVDW